MREPGLRAFVFMKEKIYYLYQHTDIDGIVFYIGKGTKQEKRGYGGYPRAFTKANRPKAWFEKSKRGYSVQIIEESTDEKYILEQEKFIATTNCPECVNKQFELPDKYVKFLPIDSQNFFILYKENTYVINISGDIYNRKGLKLQPILSDGYKRIGLYSNRRSAHFYVHRLIAMAWIENSNNYPVVNHKDGNKLNNSIENLEWCTQQENTQHAHDIGLHKNKIFSHPVLNGRIVEVDKNYEIIQYWNNYEDLCSDLNLVSFERANLRAILSQTTDKCLIKKRLFMYEKYYFDSKTPKIEKSLFLLNNDFRYNKIPEDIHKEVLDTYHKSFNKDKSNHYIIADIVNMFNISDASIRRILKDDQLYISHDRNRRTEYLLDKYGNMIYEKGYLRKLFNDGEITDADRQRMLTYCHKNPI